MRIPLSAALFTAFLAACSSPDFTQPASTVGSSPRAAAAPTAPLSCTAAQHDRFTATGPDGKQYASWHPAIDPLTGCSYGHEHGRDPKGSKLFALTGNIPFGYVNAQLDVYDPSHMRHEDHFGHKIEWENDVKMQRTVNGARQYTGVTCNFLMKIHQGTHSPDAFTHNLHELLYYVQCSDGTDLRAQILSAIGNAGEFVRSCDKSTVVRPAVGTVDGVARGAGVRFIPDAYCIDRYVMVPGGAWSDMSRALYEDWITSNYITTPTGKTLAYFDPHFAVFTPSRYFNATESNVLSRSLDVCFAKPADGRRARTGLCDASTNYGANVIAWDDSRSVFNGVQRETYFNQTTLTNKGGATVWYTDPYGGRASTAPFPGSVRQVIGSVDNRKPYPYESQAFGASRRYGANGTHAPN